MLVVQEKSVNGARRLLVNATEQGEPQGPVTVQLTESKAYQVTVFPIREGMGILESNVAYTVEIVLDVVGARWVSVGKKMFGPPPFRPLCIIIMYFHICIQMICSALAMQAHQPQQCSLLTLHPHQCWTCFQ